MHAKQLRETLAERLNRITEIGSDLEALAKPDFSILQEIVMKKLDCQKRKEYDVETATVISFLCLLLAP
jgi:hypothetical protein